MFARRIEEKVIYYRKVYDTDIMNFHAGETIIRCEGPERKLVLLCLIIYDGERLRNGDYFFPSLASAATGFLAEYAL